MFTKLLRFLDSLTVMVSLVANYGLLNFQTVTNFMRATNVEFTTAPAIKFNTCYLLGFVLTFIELLFFQFYHLPDFVFRVGKKAMENRQALLQFLVIALACANCRCAWLCALLFLIPALIYFFNYFLFMFINLIVIFSISSILVYKNYFLPKYNSTTNHLNYLRLLFVLIYRFCNGA